MAELTVGSGIHFPKIKEYAKPSYFLGGNRMAKRLLRLPAVIDRTGSSSSDIYEGMKDGTFPKSVPIGKRTVGWVEDEVEGWINARIVARDSKSIKRQGGPGRGHKGSRNQSDNTATKSHAA
jgi:prophage regulatory protein